MGVPVTPFKTKMLRCVGLSSTLVPSGIEASLSLAFLFTLSESDLLFADSSSQTPFGTRSTRIAPGISESQHKPFLENVS